MIKSVNYPPKDILNPTFEKPNYELIILWILNNNKKCNWQGFLEKIKSSTLSLYLRRLLEENIVEKDKNRQYSLTAKGIDRFYALSAVYSVQRKLNYPPKPILLKREYKDLILWMVFNNSFCLWSDFFEKPLSMNQSSLSKNLSSLIEQGFVKKQKRQYLVSQSGKFEYSKMIGSYELDKQSILNEEIKRIKEITSNTKIFFKKYRIEDGEVRFLFINYILKLPYEIVKKTLTDQEEFNKILLYLSLNHPNNYPKTISLEVFSYQYNIKKTTLEYYTQLICENKVFPTRFFNLIGENHNIYYFAEDGKLEKILRAEVSEYIRKISFLSEFFEDSNSQMNQFDMDFIINNIVIELCQYLFHPDLENSLRKLLPDYINHLAFVIQKKSKFTDTIGRIESIIWQDFQFYSLNSQKDSNSDLKNVKTYYLNPSILLILEPYFETKILKIFQKLLDRIKLGKEFTILNDFNFKTETGFDDFSVEVFKSIIFSFFGRIKKSVLILKEVEKNSRLIKNEKNFLIFDFLMSYLQLCFGKYEISMDISDKLIERSPNNYISFALRGIIEGYNHIYEFNLSEKSESIALDYIEKAISLIDDDVKLVQLRLFQLKSEIFAKSNKNNEAINELNKGIRLKPDLIDLINSKIKLLVDLGRYDQSLKILKYAVKHFPAHEIDLTIKRAHILKLKGNIEDGLQIIENLDDNYPNNSEILKNKALWLHYLNKNDEAIEIIQDLIRQNPDSLSYYELYGEIMMYQRFYEKAIENFENCIKINDSNWSNFQILMKIGICNKELGKVELALKNLNEGLILSDACYCEREEKLEWQNIARLYINLISRDLN